MLSSYPLISLFLAGQIEFLDLAVEAFDFTFG
jgi:hypothetical protein